MHVCQGWGYQDVHGIEAFLGIIICIKSEEFGYALKPSADEHAPTGIYAARTALRCFGPQSGEVALQASARAVIP